MAGLADLAPALLFTATAPWRMKLQGEVIWSARFSKHLLLSVLRRCRQARRRYGCVRSGSVLSCRSVAPRNHAPIVRPESSLALNPCSVACRQSCVAAPKRSKATGSVARPRSLPLRTRARMLPPGGAQTLHDTSSLGSILSSTPAPAHHLLALRPRVSGPSAGRQGDRAACCSPLIRAR
jgi:hypothetical protein